ncbi:putative Ni/Fe-hydrogenase B-type cytochrome subunit [Mariprofundus micogutta]|uniref:Putative Ni/Fe-hydrogenase B-type cytochrome subunit n=1 Tax=Mariprofundus micogutta TaxID=1921010 RepID=A0A1L8CPE6_9PROT|nr:cytochrome b/b6 domain-containing protein [Mariprofundus micogutta]GAV20792.1 putative Ni/Fe-hydrogenase B-type cytochrome subunit [Mariprofundus micogutta]
MPQSIKVWDILVRLFHWSLVLFFILAYLTAEGDLETMHAWAGYTIAGLIGFRLIWGLIGTKYARFSNFIYRPAEIRTYLRSLMTRHSKHYLGHNPAGGAMVAMMLVALVLVTWTGLETYAAEGKGPLANSSISLQIPAAHADGWEHGDNQSDEFWKDVHEFTVNMMLMLILIHIAGVLVSSLLHGENLPRAMITGRKSIQDSDQQP